mgnify:CR=1 FL=1
MRISRISVAASLAGLALAGCAVSRYPVVSELQAVDVQAMSCAALQQERDALTGVERRIGEIAATGRAADGSTPVLYTTDRAGAERAARTRAEAIAAGQRARGCA